MERTAALPLNSASTQKRRAIVSAVALAAMVAGIYAVVLLKYVVAR